MLTSLKLKIGISVIGAALLLSSSHGLFAQTGEGESAQVAPKSDQDDAKTAEDAKDDSADKAEEKVNGQADLDKAFEKKIVVSSTRDLDDIADLCESAIEKGLDAESEKQAKELWASVLYQHAVQLNRAISPNGTLSTRWRWLRQQAISRLSKVIEIKPDKVDALILLAKLHSLNNGNREAAIEAIEKAIAKITDDKQKLSEALFIRSRLAEDENTRIADLTQAVKINPDNFEALMQRALYYLSKEQISEAMTDFKQLLLIEKENTDRHIVISQALRQRRLFKESAEILDAAVEIEPENDNLLVLRGQAYFASDNNELALSDLNKAIELNRQNVEAINLRARVHLIMDNFDKAIDDANELIQQRPESTVGLALRSLIYRSQQKLPEAIKDLEAILEKDADNLDFKFDLAILLNADNRPSKAIPLYDEIIYRLPPPAQSQILRNRGDAFLSLGKHQKAIDDYETALDLMDENAGSDIDGMSNEREKETRSGLLNNLAWVLATSPDDSLRDGKRSVELATEASKLTDYKEAFILSTLASGYAEMGDFEMAKKWAAKGVELAGSEEQRKGIQDELDSYNEGKAWRELENVEAERDEKDPAEGESESSESDKEKQTPNDEKNEGSDAADSDN